MYASIIRRNVQCSSVNLHQETKTTQSRYRHGPSPDLLLGLVSTEARVRERGFLWGCSIWVSWPAVLRSVSFFLVPVLPSVSVSFAESEGTCGRSRYEMVDLGCRDCSEVCLVAVRDSREPGPSFRWWPLGECGLLDQGVCAAESTGRNAGGAICWCAL